VLRLSLAGQHGRGAIARPAAQITIYAASVGQPKPRIHRPVSEPVESKWLIMPDEEVPGPRAVPLHGLAASNSLAA
jgi:hypothetical protein